ALRFAWMANLFWTVINLLPILPLDGGHLLSIVLEAIFGFKGIRIAVIAGLVIAVLISLLFLAMGAILPAILFLFLTFESFRALRYYRLFREKDRDSDLQALLESAESDYAHHSIDSALSKYEKVRIRSREGILYTLATEKMAMILKEEHHIAHAYQLLLSIE